MLLFVGCLTLQQHARSARTIVRPATQTEVADHTCYTCILTPDQPIPALTLERKASGRIAGSINLYSHWYDSTWKKTSTVKAGIYYGGWYHGGRRSSSDDSLHSPTVVPPSALDKPSIMKCYHRRRTCSHTSPRRSHDTQFVECRWWNDGWTVDHVCSCT